MAAASASSSCLLFLFRRPSSASFPCGIQFRDRDRVSFVNLRDGHRNGRAALLQAKASGKKKKRKSGGNTSNGRSSGSRKDRDPIDPDESLGFFPEALLLRKKAVQVQEEDAQALPQFADAEEEKLYQSLSLELESGLQLQRMRHYEVVFLIHEKHDDEVEEIVTRVEDFIREKKGRMWRLNDWGLRELAYEVKKAVEAHYILMNFEIDTRFINDFKTMLDKDERVIRHLVTKQDKAETEYSPPPMDYPTLLAKQGLGDDDGFWDDDDDDYTVYNDDDGDDGHVTGGGEDEGEVIYVDGDGEEGPEEMTDGMREVENARR